LPCAAALTAAHHLSAGSPSVSSSTFFTPPAENTVAAPLLSYVPPTSRALSMHSAIVASPAWGGGEGWAERSEERAEKGARCAPPSLPPFLRLSCAAASTASKRAFPFFPLAAFLAPAIPPAAHTAAAPALVAGPPSSKAHCE
jgi:hypothetical protein